MRADAWLAALDHELRAHKIDTTQRIEVVAEAEGILEESGEEPVAHFGLPDVYASLVAAAITRRDPSNPIGPVVVTASGVSHRFGNQLVLRPTDLELRGGQIVALLGDNGAGKSTLLEILAGLRQPTAGTVSLDAAVGYAPQTGGLNPWLTPMEHVLLFGAAFGLDGDEARSRGHGFAADLLLDLETSTVVGRLSGGTQQKVRVVTALVGHPGVLLLDEPYQGLDAESTRRFWDLLWHWGALGGAVVVASHALDALRCADRVVDLSDVAA